MACSAPAKPGVQLTWMDAKVGDWVVTPRIGKPVEIKALWYNALRIVAAFRDQRGDAGAAALPGRGRAGSRQFSPALLATQMWATWRRRRWPVGDELHLRPNQILALSLPHALLDGAPAETAFWLPSAARC